jgi:ribosomal protein S18 acetylase RimI-like enzyme
MRIDPLSLTDIARLRPLWLALHAHHQDVAPHLAPFVSDEQSWTDRKRQYEKVLSGEGFGFVAHNRSSDIGYLLCTKQPMKWTATFAMPPMLWELVTLFVNPDWRGQGIGSMMLDAMDEVIAHSDVQVNLVGVIPDNRRAIALYRSRGFVPTWLTLTRFQRSPIAGVISAKIQIQQFTTGNVEALKPLWLALHHQHQTVSPDLEPFVDDEHSWSIIKDSLAKSAKDGLLLVAREDGKLTGFASVAIHDTATMSEYSDTWLTGDKIAETKFLVIAEDSRGQGIGRALLDAVGANLAERGVCDHLISAIAPNARAIHFYESRGFQPAWLEMVKRSNIAPNQNRT